VEACLVRVEEKEEEAEVRAATPKAVPTSASRAGPVKEGTKVIPLPSPPAAPLYKNAAAFPPPLLLLRLLLNIFLRHSLTPGPASASLIVPCKIKLPNTTNVPSTNPPTNTGIASLFFFNLNRRCVHSIKREATGAKNVAPATRKGFVTCEPAQAIATTFKKRRDVANILAPPPTFTVSTAVAAAVEVVVMVPPLVCHQTIDTARVYQRAFRMP